VNYGDLVHSWSEFGNDASTTKYAELLYHHIDAGAVIDWDFKGPRASRVISSGGSKLMYSRVLNGKGCLG
jgi:hypothetical protein